MLGLKKGHVDLINHQDSWCSYANDIIKKLIPIFKNTTQFEHIGSTNIPSIKAKPIIDLAVGVESFDEVKSNIHSLASLGFIYYPNIGDETLMYFNKKNSDALTTHHLHILLNTSQAFKNHLYFRDYLRENIDVAKAYENLKIKLAKIYPNDRDSYTKQKNHFIQSTIRKAQASHYLGKIVTITIDRPIGTAHPKHPTIVYPINYGYIPNEIAPDDEELDVYLLDLSYPVKQYTGKIIAIVHRENDVEDKLVMSSESKNHTRDMIAKTIHFQEQFYKSHIELLNKNNSVKD